MYIYVREYIKSFIYIQVRLLVWKYKSLTPFASEFDFDLASVWLLGGMSWMWAWICLGSHNPQSEQVALAPNLKSVPNNWDAWAFGD